MNLVFFRGDCIMKLHLKPLQRYPQDGLTFHFAEPGDDRVLREMGVSFADVIVVDLTVNTSAMDFVATGKVKTRLQTGCSRCLGKLVFPIEADLSCLIMEKQDEAARGDVEEDVVFSQQGEADIEDLVYGLVLAEIPLNPLCSEACRGLCPVCGQNLNQESCTCIREDHDPRWDKLKQLKEQLENEEV